MTVTTAIILFLLLAIMGILLHECGHMIAGKMFGIKTEEFVVGMGPTLFKKKAKDTEYKLKLLVFFGGYCKMDDEATYKLSLHRKYMIYLAGVICNMLLSFSELFLAFFISNPNKSLIEIIRHSFGRFGMYIGQALMVFPNAIKQIFSGAERDIAGAYYELGSTIATQPTIINQISSLLAAAAFLNILLAIFNILPIPGLDGGQLVVTTVTEIKEKQGKKVRYEIVDLMNIVGVGMVIFITGILMLI